MSPYSICFAKRPRSRLLRSQPPCVLCEQRQQSRASSSLLRPPGSLWHCGSSCLLPGNATEPVQLIDGHPPGAWETKNPWCGVLSTEKAQGRARGPKEKTMILPKAMFWPFQPCRCAEKCGGREAGWTQVSRVSRSEGCCNLGISSWSLSMQYSIQEWLLHSHLNIHSESGTNLEGAFERHVFTAAKLVNPR